MSDKPTIFICYSHDDAKWKDRLVKHLRACAGDRFDVWDDQRLAAGDDWRAEVLRALNAASAAATAISGDTAAFVGLLLKASPPSLMSSVGTHPPPSTRFENMPTKAVSPRHLNNCAHSSPTAHVGRC